jgi:hypothetical protein
VPPCQRTTRLRPSPSPLGTQRRRAADRSPAGSSAAQRVQGIAHPAGPGYPLILALMIAQDSPRSHGFNYSKGSGEGLTRWVILRGFGGRGDRFTFRAGKAKIRHFLNCTRIKQTTKRTPRTKRAKCHHHQKGTLGSLPSGLGFVLMNLFCRIC